ncbi:hypothetical protein L204_102281 [Cryptococcus depauperatus]|nr:hypothetical protein L204_06012 [Cryptococcus depauperatus CBS 7855]
MNLSRSFNGKLQCSTTYQPVSESPSEPGSEASQQGSARSPSVESPNPPDQPGFSSFQSGQEWLSGPWNYRAGVYLGRAVEKFDNMTKGGSKVIPDDEATEIRKSMSGLSTRLKEKETANVDLVATIEETKRLINRFYGYQDMPECSDVERRGINHVTESLYHAHEALSELESAPSVSANSVAPSVLGDADR